MGLVECVVSFTIQGGGSPILEQRREPEQPEEEVGHDEIEHPPSVVLDEVRGRGSDAGDPHGFPLRLR